jgi:transcriptional regulator with XRE-family HTH domain
MVLFDRLSYVEGPVEVVRILHEQLGLTEKDLARAAGVRHESVSRWLAGNVSNMHARDSINDLRYVVMALLRARTMTLPRIAYWLCSRNLYLGVEPVEAIANGEFERVVEVGLAHAEGRTPDIAARV